MTDEQTGTEKEEPVFFTDGMQEELDRLNQIKKQTREAQKGRVEEIFAKLPQSFVFDNVLAAIKGRGGKSLTHTYGSPEGSKFGDYDLQITFRASAKEKPDEAPGEGEPEEAV